MNRNASKVSLWLGLACVTLIAATQRSALAVSLNPGDTVALSGTTEALEPFLADVEQVEQQIPFSFYDPATDGTIRGTLDNRVFKENGTGTLDFIYAVTLDDARGPAASILTSNFGTGNLDVDYRLDSLGAFGPTLAVRFTGSDAGVVDFFFGDPNIQGGDTTHFCFIRTTATQYDLSGFTEITAPGLNGGISDPIATYAPVSSAVPVPSAFSLTFVGLAGVIAYRSRKLMAK